MSSSLPPVRQPYPEGFAYAEDPMVHVLRATPQTRTIMTHIRNRETSRGDFVFYTDRMTRLLIEEALTFLPYHAKEVTTPTGAVYEGLEFESHICGVSIIRAGESMEKPLREVCLGVRIGKILIQRNESDATAQLYYHKLPRDIASRKVLLLDPMLATGGSCGKAINVLKQAGVPEENIVFVNLIAAPEGIKAIRDGFPKVQIVVAEVDDGLNEKAYIVPGLGDHGCLYFGTV
jgi:uracil phosphoribosyltransferase